MRIRKLFPEGCTKAVIPDKLRYKTRYKMTVTEDELEILRALLWSVRGNPDASPRKEVDSMSEAMDSACEKVGVEPRWVYDSEEHAELVVNRWGIQQEEK